MSNEQRQPPQAVPVYPQAQVHDGAAAENYVVSPPPVGYPVKDGYESGVQNPPSQETDLSKGDGFWRGCCAGLCCCCLLDACF